MELKNIFLCVTPEALKLYSCSRRSAADTERESDIAPAGATKDIHLLAAACKIYVD